MNGPNIKNSLGHNANSWASTKEKAHLLAHSWRLTSNIDAASPNTVPPSESHGTVRSFKSSHNPIPTSTASGVNMRHVVSAIHHTSDSICARVALALGSRL